jgi:hypothetical protein
MHSHWWIGLAWLPACGSPTPAPAQHSVALVPAITPPPSASITPVEALEAPLAVVDAGKPFDNRAWCLAEAAKREPSWPCELPRDGSGRPEARADHTLQCGHLLTPICKADELCSQRALTGMKPTWMHGSVFCYAVPQACSNDVTCGCIKPVVMGRTSCPRGTFFDCAPPSDQHPDLTIDCADIR